MSVTWRVDPMGLRQPFRDDVTLLLALSPYAWTVTYGLRTLAEQEALFKKYQAGGPRAAPPGKSPHNFGLAIDVALDGSPDPGLQPDWDTTHAGWVWLFDAIFAHPRLHSGKSFHDADHVEAVGWKAIAVSHAAPVAA